MSFPGERPRRRWTDFSRFCLDPAVRFSLGLELSAFDTSSLQFPSTPAYSKIVLTPAPSLPDKPTDKRQEPPTVLPAGSHLQFPVVSSKPPCRFKPCQALTETLGKSPLTLHSCPSVRVKGEGTFWLRSRRGRHRYGWSLGLKGARQDPLSPLSLTATQTGHSSLLQLPPQPPLQRMITRPLRSIAHLPQRGVRSRHDSSLPSRG